MRRDRAGRRLFWIAIAALAAGCRDASRPPADLGVPDPTSSRAALAVALDAWKSGRRDSGILIGSKPSIGVVDAARAERRLADYRVVGPLMVVGKARPFAVELVLDGPRETVAARYLVMGQDPLWVFRQEDFDRMVHWEHKMDDATATDPAARPPAPAEGDPPHDHPR